jgi:hypothetical protein
MRTITRLTAVAALLAAGSLTAQESYGTVVGSVKDAAGNAVAGARLSLKGAKILGGREARTNDRGEFRLPLLPPGEYTLEVSREGFVGSRSSFYVSSGQTLRQPFTMREIAVAKAEVEVVAVSSTVDKTETKTSTNFNLDALQSLPTGSINSYGALSVAPGVVGSVSYPQIRGSAAGQSTFTINGVSAKDPMVRQGRQSELLLDDMTEDVAVVQSPLNARYGNTSGGMVNLVTKSGTNSFAATLRVKLAKDSWNALHAPWKRRYAVSGNEYYSNGDTIQSDSLSRTYEITVSGPIIKDHLTFAYGTRLEPTSTTSFSLVNMVRNNYMGMPMAGVAANSYGVDPANPEDILIRGNTKASFHSYKLFWMINQLHQLEVFQTINKRGPALDGTNQPGLNVDANSDFNQKSDSTFSGLNYRGVIGSNGVLDFRLGNLEKKVRFSSGPGDPIAVRAWRTSANDYAGSPYWTFINPNAGKLSPGLVWTMGTTGSLQDEERNSRTLSLNYNLILGDHTLDMGVEQLRDEVFSPESFGPNSELFYTPGYTADGRYLAINFWGSVVDPTAAGYSAALNAQATGRSGVIPERRVMMSTGDANAKAHFTTNSMYVNDLWTINSHWSVMGGLRFDQWKVEDRSGERVKTNGFSPRAEVKWDVRGDNAHLLSFSYAWLRSTLSSGSMGTAIRNPGNIIQKNYWNTGSTTALYLVNRDDVYNDANYRPYTYSNSDLDRDINPDVRPDRAVEYALNYRRAYTNGGSFRSTLVYRKVSDLLYLKGDGSSFTLPNPFMGVTYATVPTSIHRTLTFDPYGKREHYGLEMEFSYPIYRSAAQSLVFAGNWSINRDYGREQFLDGNVEENGIRFDSQLMDAGYPLEAFNPEGELSSSVHNVARAWLTWDLTSSRGIRSTMTVLGSYSSGSPYSLTNSVQRPGTVPTSTAKNISAFAFFYNGRGHFYNPQSFSVDLQWNLTFPLVRGVALTSYLMVGNLFNHYQVKSYSRTAYGNYRPTWSANATYWANGSDLSAWGVPTGFTGGRTVSLDLGLRF